LSEVLFPKPEQGALRETLIERWADNDPRAYIEATRGLLDWDVTDRLNSIHCPTLVISAEHDTWPVEEKAAYVRLIPNAQLVVIDDAQHFVSLERPEETNAALMDFLARHL
jgi:pimeloyl-ACP methyl ester carboxylesterase